MHIPNQQMLAVLSAAAVFGLLSCHPASEAVEVPRPDRIVVEPGSVVLGRFASFDLHPQLLDSKGTPIPDATFTFSLGDVALIEVSVAGRVRSRGPSGVTHVVVRSGSISQVVPVEVAAPTRPTGVVRHVIFSSGASGAAIDPDGAFYVTGDGVPVKRGLLSSPLTALTPVSDIVGGSDVGLSDDGSKAYFGRRGQLAEVLTSTGEVSQRSPTGQRWTDLTGYAFSPDGSTLYAAAAPGFVYAIDRANLQVLWMLTPFAYIETPAHIAIDATGTYLFVSGNDFGKSARIDTRDRTVVSLPGEGTGRVTKEIAVSSDGQFIVRADESGGVDVMSITDPSQQSRISLPSCSAWGLAFTRDDTQLYVTCPFQRAITVIDWATRNVAQVIAVPQPVLRIRMSLDGRTAIAAGSNYVVIIQ